MEIEEKLKIAEQALRDIINPIGKMVRELRDGYQLNGGAAYQLAHDPQYLADIAKEALYKIESNASAHPRLAETLNQKETATA